MGGESLQVIAMIDKALLGLVFCDTYIAPKSMPSLVDQTLVAWVSDVIRKIDEELRKATFSRSIVA